MYYFLNLLIPKNCFTVIIKHADCCPTPFFSLTIFTVMIEVSEKWQRKLKATFYMYKCYSYFSALVSTFINFCRVISWIMQIWITQILGSIRAAMPPSSQDPLFLVCTPKSYICILICEVVCEVLPIMLQLTPALCTHLYVDLYCVLYATFFMIAILHNIFYIVFARLLMLMKCEPFKNYVCMTTTTVHLLCM